ncbi:hypothetical protein [Chromobacterium haemolyticum]|uniref:hypothetical protein n=1 Tax=Chromobacterium haemolyticum TaxID=394935 RepID=UPI0011B1C9B8|nr:hypothetical protein [Chromobacterium haemolyticum]
MSIERQIELLTELAQIVHESAEEPYSEAHCDFEYKCSEKDWVFGFSFSYAAQGVSKSKLLKNPQNQVPELVHELHEIMLHHTAGFWKQFVLSIDADGKAHTNFVY